MKKLLLLSLFSVAAVAFAQQGPSKKFQKQENPTKESKAVNTQGKAATLKNSSHYQQKATQPVSAVKEATLKAEPVERKR
ncbi:MULTISPECIES: hypothetical protein [Weeksella]|uniref:Uncharacterized protein n=1 Tax=Weeksella virosa (strain ATCC 43766 / DSM 16922 / JCM 21250 / CCUG 30538 / CDC 9751 / IAM 14551 / NBRC 16016 / NCTC 11634 / CL345/78) TaxID=865938 RepID=F0P1X3_WEEVC|nr:MULTISPECIES: hypothetical protein [Weeksella]ADX67683.1 hypothetical protein Weevi_0974 [Weeksella virosa DSM 16922]MDK7373975.1 hypothetical protein [Weeksella virosa]MDK7674230.1 hypothetical protein [Weeksella virosa]OFM82663.1 hypothetical protein HMPREF2660_03135 [Weeksella sp. HMSC059D05]SUP53982.1 Uncharacterised protein [Weeksella virosa]